MRAGLTPRGERKISQRSCPESKVQECGELGTTQMQLTVLGYSTSGLLCAYLIQPFPQPKQWDPLLRTEGWRFAFTLQIRLIACTLFPSPCTHWETNPGGSASKGKVQARLGTTKSCWLWGIININNAGIVSALDARN